MRTNFRRYFLAAYGTSVVIALMQILCVWVAAFGLAGCHSSSSDAAPSPVSAPPAPAPILPEQALPKQAPHPPATPEQLAFEDMSSFYCAHKRWPQSWKEFVDGSAGAGWIGEFKDAEVNTARAIVSNVRYRDARGAEKTVAFIAPPSCKVDPSKDDPHAISIAGGRVSFTLPDGFSLLKASNIQSRWGRPPYPDVAWEDPVSQVVLALRFGEVALTEGALRQLKPELEAAYQGSVPGVRWINRSFRTDDGPPRLVHQFESDSSHGRLVTLAFTFSFDEKLFTITVIGPAEQRAAVEQVAVAVRSTLRLQ